MHGLLQRSGRQPETRSAIALTFLIVVFSLSACSDTDSKKPPSPGSSQNDIQRDRPDEVEASMARLGSFGTALQARGILPSKYRLILIQTTGKTKNEIFEAWFQEKLKVVDQRMAEEMNEWKYLDAKESRQEEVGTLRSDRAVADTAENFYFAADLSQADLEILRKHLTELMKSGVEIGFNGFDLKSCGETEESRQMDDYVISPLFIEPQLGRVYEFQYRGGCRN